MYSQACVSNDNIPPTKGAFKQHVLRAAHQYLQYKTACKALIDVRNPQDYGWLEMQNEFVPQTTENKIAPDSVVQMVSCNCQKGCVKGCNCQKHGEPCTDFCGCTAATADDCQNTDPPMLPSYTVGLGEEDDE